MKAVLFDMDGTLVPMDQVTFTHAYFGALCKKMSAHGYKSDELVNAVWKGTRDMVENDGSSVNRDVFWRSMANIFGERATTDIKYFDDFYATDFSSLKSEVGFNENAAKTVMRIKSRGLKLVLASNPVFPMLAQTTRVGWANIDAAVFDRITSYDNSHYCKPNPAYYTEIAEAIDCAPQDCLMIGNDAEEDGAAAEAGMNVFILTECLINARGIDISAFEHGDYNDLRNYLDRLSI